MTEQTTPKTSMRAFALIHQASYNSSNRCSGRANIPSEASVGRWANKYVIGLTGNIGMGKSLVRKMLENLGAYTIDADGLSHQAMAPGAPAYAPVIQTFGTWIVDADKKIDRSKLGAVAFSHRDALNELEKLTHPVVGQAIDILVSRAKQPIVVIEAIKLVDGVLGDQVDTVWVVDATTENQLQRLITRRGMSDWEARKRIETQNPQRDKIDKASVVINNNGTPEEVWAHIQREWEKIMAAVTKTRPPQQQTQLAARPPTAQAASAQQAPPAQQTARPPTPTAQQTQPAAAASPVQQAARPPAPTAQPTAPPANAQIAIKRGLPKNAEAIARLLNQISGKSISRNDIMMAFGEKSYLLAEAGTTLIGLAGFQVENLITRMDEFVIIPQAPTAPVAKAMINAMEEASRDLQSEVSFVFIPRSAPAALLQAFTDQGYEKTEIDALKVPAWREAAAEVEATDKQILMKKLRAERVLTPV